MPQPTPPRAGAKRWWWPALPIVVAVVGPWQLHAAASTRLGAALGETGKPASIDVHATGVTIAQLAVNVSRARLRSGQAHVFLRGDGVHVELDELHDSRVEIATKSRAPTRRDRDRDAATARAPTTANSHTRLPFDPPLPIRIRASGELHIDTDRPARLVARDPSLDLLPGPAWTGSATGQITWGPDELARYDARVRATAANDLGVEITITPRIGAPIHAAALQNGHGTRLELSSDEGTATVRVGPRARLDRFDLEVDAQRFPLAALGSLPIAERWTSSTTDATATGGAKLTRRDDHWQVELAAFAVQDVAIEHRLLSREPVKLDTVTATGTVDHRAGVWSAELDLAHNDVHVQTSARLGVSTAALKLNMAPTSCQAVLDALPIGLAPLLAGMRVDGDVAARVEVAFPLSVLDALPADAELPETAPGDLDLDLPFLEQCRVIADAPHIDLDALAGTYTHRFRQADGTSVERAMSIESPAFTPLVQIPDIGRAFVVMEDSNFWTHDGFDREQMARAFWYNLGVGKVSRGASTITQQTARNLWLGGQRTLARKLQEAVLAARLEAKLSKPRILELYLNIIELGPGIHGVHEAAQYHFGRDPEDLDLLQALHLAALAPAPVPLSRKFDDGQANAEWQAELREQVRRMQLRGMISKRSAHAALRSSLRLRARE